MRHIVRIAAFGSLAITGQAGAVLVGTSPDSPAAHVDANVITSPYAGVVGVNVTSLGPASGVLLRTNDTTASYVLTAAHALDHDRNGVAEPLANMSVHVNYSGNSSTVLGVTSVHINPAWYVNTGPSFPHDDVAILKLNGVVPAGVPTYNIHRTLISSAPNQNITIVGYGQSGDGVNGVTVGNGVNVKRTGQNVADAAFTNDEGGPAFEIYTFDYDGPSGNGSQGGPTLGNATEVQFGIGDSGSPAFITGAGGEQLIWGLNTFAFNTGSGNYPLFGSGGGGQLVSGYQSFIDGVVPIPEPSSIGVFAIGLGLLARRRRVR